MVGRRALSVLVMISFGCARTPLDPESMPSLRQSANAQCAQADTAHESAPVEAADPALQHYLEQVPPQLRRSVLATGLEPLLGATLKERDEGKLDRLARGRELDARLDALHAQFSDFLSEAECAGESLQDLRGELERRKRRRVRGMGIAALALLLASAAAAVVYEARVHDEYGGPIIVSVGAAGATAMVLASAWRIRRPVLLHHERNLLRPILRGSDPKHIYPSFVFRMLSAPLPDDSPPPRDQLLAQWRRAMEEAVKPEDRLAAEQLLYGTGGIYTPELVLLRQTMLEQLEAQLSAIRNEVELLEPYLASTINGGLVGPL